MRPEVLVFGRGPSVRRRPAHRVEFLLTGLDRMDRGPAPGNCIPVFIVGPVDNGGSASFIGLLHFAGKDGIPFRTVVVHERTARPALARTGDEILEVYRQRDLPVSRQAVGTIPFGRRPFPPGRVIGPIGLFLPQERPGCGAAADVQVGFQLHVFGSGHWMRVAFLADPQKAAERRGIERGGILGVVLHPLQFAGGPGGIAELKELAPILPDLRRRETVQLGAAVGIPGDGFARLRDAVVGPIPAVGISPLELLRSADGLRLVHQADATEG